MIEVPTTDVTGMRRTYHKPNHGNWPTAVDPSLQKIEDLRYGENPNQEAARFRFADSPLAERLNIQLIQAKRDEKGELSATNLMDISKGMYFVGFLSRPTSAVIKHTLLSGAARQREGESLYSTFLRSRDTDRRSAHGGTVVLNRPVDTTAAEAIASRYIEVVAAPGYEEGAAEIISRRWKNARIATFEHLEAIPRFIGDSTAGLHAIKPLEIGEAVVQQPYLSSIRSADDLKLRPLVRWTPEGKAEQSIAVARAPTVEETTQLLFSWYANLVTRSNGIVLAKDWETLAIGSGRTERIGALEDAVSKTLQKALDRKRGADGESIDWTPGGMSWKEMLDELGYNPLQGAVCSSDGFFPFRDSIDLLGKMGITAVVQPGGGERDREVIAAVNEYMMAMVFTLERCFLH